MSATKPKPKKTRKGLAVPQKNLEAVVARAEEAMRKAQSQLAPYSIGDTVRVHVKIKEDAKVKEGGKDKDKKAATQSQELKERIQVFEGLVIARSNRGVNKTLTVRKISHGIGVERIFLEASPHVARIEVIQKSKVRRAKLYYLRDREGKAVRLEKDLSASLAAHS